MIICDWSNVQSCENAIDVNPVSSEK